MGLGAGIGRPRNAAVLMGTYDPSPFTWQEFLRQWECACVDAWEAGQQEPAVTLPHNVFPLATGVFNTYTGTVVPIIRMSPFDWDTSRCACGAQPK